MRRVRGVFLGVAMAVPFAGLFATAVPAAAANPSCPGTITINQSFNVSLVTTHGDAGSAVTITGSNFPIATNFNNGGNVYFTDSTGSQSQRVAFSQGDGGNGSQVTVTAPSAYTGRVMVCISSDSYQALTSASFAYVPKVTSVPSSTTEGTNIVLNGRFIPNTAATVRLGGGASGCTTSATGVAFSVLHVTVPGYCPGTISVAQVAPDQTNLVGPYSGQSLAILPTISGVTPTTTTPGQPITISGTGFSGLASVLLGGAQASPSSASDRQIVVPAPDGVNAINSAKVITSGGSTGGGSNPDWSGTVTVLPRLSSVTPGSAADGGTLTISGVDFGNANTPGAVTLGGQPLTLKAWGMDQVQAVIPAGAVPGKIALVRGDDRQAAVNTLGFSLTPVINGMSPTKAPVGTQVYIAGSTFGSNQGSVTVGGLKATISLWSDTAIDFQVPKGAQSGKVMVTTGYGNVLAGPSFTVLTPGSKPSGQTVLVPCAICSSSAAGQINGFLPPPNAPPPIALHLTTPVNHVDPGSAVPLTVTMTLNGKPLAGSKVALNITSQPSTDGMLTPANGVTDAKGQLEVNLKLSGKVGATLITATSGTFSDTLTVLGIAPPAPVKPESGLAQVPTAAGLDMKVYWPFAVGIGVAILLLLSVLVLQIWLHRHSSRQPAPAPVPEDKPRRTRRAKVVDVAAAVAAPAEPAAAAPVPATEATAGRAKKPATRKVAPRTAPARRPRKKVEVAAEEPAPSLAEIVPLPTPPNHEAKRRRRKVVAEAPPAEVADVAPISRTRARAKKTS